MARRHPGTAFRMGFHAIPSMRLLHLHVISQDFVSPTLCTRAHWNAFTTGFFLDIDWAIASLEQDGRVEIDRESAKRALGTALRCHQCPRAFDSMSGLKTHLQSHCQ